MKSKYAIQQQLRISHKISAKFVESSLKNGVLVTSGHATLCRKKRNVQELSVRKLPGVKRKQNIAKGTKLTILVTGYLGFLMFAILTQKLNILIF